MRLLSKIFFSLLLFIVAALFLLTVSINGYLQYSNAKGQLIDWTQGVLGKPVSIGKCFFTPWSGLSVKNLVMMDPARPFSLEISSLSIEPQTLMRIVYNKTIWHGPIFIKKILVNNQPVLKNIHTEVFKSENALSITPFVAKMLGGKIQGAFSLRKLDDPSLPYEFSAAVFGIPLRECLVGTEFQNRVTAGNLHGTLTLQGTLGTAATQSGFGTVELTEGELKSADFFGSLSRLFPLEELQFLRLKEAKANYAILSDRIQLTSIRLQSENLLLKASGMMDFNQNVNLNARLLLSESLQQRLQSVIPRELTPAKEVGYKEINFNITGSGAHLQTDFWNQLFGQQVQKDLGGLLQGLLNKALSQ